MTLSFDMKGSMADALRRIADEVQKHDLVGKVQFSGIPLTNDPNADWHIDITEMDAVSTRLLTPEGEFVGREANARMTTKDSK
jgi:hypothetical protein